MKVAIIQLDVEQGEFEKNLEKVERLSAKAKSAGADLAVFPEMFLCGFNYKKNLKFLQENGDSAEAALCEIARKNSISICGSVPHLSKGNELPSNRFLFVSDNGEIVSKYDKTHLFSVFNEDKYVKAGEEIVVAETPLGKMGFAVCYDVRFPDLFVRMTKRGAEIIIISSAFPHPRSEHWRVLLRARAIENQCFVIGVNQSGSEMFGENEVKYFGLSAIIDPWGGIVAECKQDAVDEIAIAEINLGDVDDIRAKIPALADRRDDLY